MPKYFSLDVNSILVPSQYSLQNLEDIEVGVNRFNSFIDNFANFYNNNKIKLLYRGDNKQNLISKFFSDHSDFTEEKLYERIFYFGDKAKYFFKNVQPSISSISLKHINDVSDNIFINIFDEFNIILANEDASAIIFDFNRENTEFSEYFLNYSNLPLFVNKKRSIKSVKNKILIRDYYLSLLHNSEFRRLNSKSFWVSTSINKETAAEFSKSGNDLGYIYIYFIPTSFYKYGIDVDIVNYIIPITKAVGLPIYYSDFYPLEFEFKVKAALFPHFIIGLYNCNKNNLVLSPYLFDDNQSDINLILKQGFFIDQSSFSTKIQATGLQSYVALDTNTSIFTEYHI